MSADAPAEESTGTSESSWIMGGRYVKEEVSGTSMGQPFEGVSILGYNNGTEQYTSYWFDNMSTGSMYTEGDYDPDTKTISSAGDFFLSVFKAERTAYRTVLTILDNNTHTYEMYMVGPDGNEFLAMQINYSRQQ